MGVLDTFSLRGKTAVVTAGAGPLFGSSISEALAEAGARVITASRSLERNREYAAALAAQTGAEVHGMELDIGDADAIGRFHDEVIDRFGNVEVLVNSALVRDATAGSFETQTIDAWQRSAAGDMVGLYAICKAFIGSMVAAGGGSVINISSIYGVVGNDPSLYEDTEMVQPPNYNFIKAGMINFTRYVANYYGKKGIRANCISPGGYYTGQAGPFVERYNKRVPMGRMMDNEDLKGAVVFLASDASAYVTGHNLLVDGGFTTIDGTNGHRLLNRDAGGPRRFVGRSVAGEQALDPCRHASAYRCWWRLGFVCDPRLDARKAGEALPPISCPCPRLVRIGHVDDSVGVH